ncbi:hypothetical protein Bca52824_066436 [Brassica carinata]|uniref:DUF223 domain-containing protein n=1 Tax=Brassica carinata TaxID=52824 RepID=A0A8X7UDD5_BRACI|nr:hypothetical protein Bca52824_066436 [Brassica carinata]
MVEVKVLHLWTQHSNGDSLQFILADKTGVKIHAICKRHFFARVQKLEVGQWRFIENFSLTPAAGNYRPTRHEYTLRITSNTNVTNSSMQNDDNFLSLTTFPEIMNGNLDSKFLIDVIGHPIDIGNIQVVSVQGKETKKLELTLTDTYGHQIATCLWGRYAEHVLYAYKVGQVNKNFSCLLRFAKISVYMGQVQITNAFEISSVEINPPGFILQDYLRLMPNDLTLTAGVPHVVKTIGNKREPEKWSLYPERTILEIIMATKCHFNKVTNITNKDLVPLKHLWHCGTCHHSVTNVTPKFKLHLLLKDDTGELPVMLLDTIAEHILGVSAEVLLDGSLEEVKDYEDLPNTINDLIGKTFKFGVYVSKDNVDYGCHIFNIGGTWSADEIFSQSDDDNTEDTTHVVVSSDHLSGQDSFVSIESAANTCFSSTPLSKRKVHNEIDDLSSTSKSRFSKIIKVEMNDGE